MRHMRRNPPFFKGSTVPKARALDKKSPGKKTSVRSTDKKPSRKPRADAARNRERVLAAAREVFSAGGADASLEAVARAAGVGIGTLYRHFPTREALFEAVYRHEAEQMAALATRLEHEAKPIEALRQWMRSFIRFVATKRGMVEALALVVTKDSALVSYSSGLLTHAIDELLSRAVDAGEIRGDVSAEDLLHAVLAICYARDHAGWQKSALRLVDVFVDGLRARRPPR